MWIYIGSGFIVGIPARNISAEEYAKMSKDDQAAVKESGLYKLQKGAIASKE